MQAKPFLKRGNTPTPAGDLWRGAECLLAGYGFGGMSFTSSWDFSWSANSLNFAASTGEFPAAGFSGRLVGLEPTTFQNHNPQKLGLQHFFMKFL